MDIYIIKPRECVSVTTSQFNHLSIVSDDRNGLQGETTLCSAKKAYNSNICQPGNYEIINDGGFFDDHIMQAIDQPNTSRNCTDIERWMEIKEQEFFNNN